MIVYVLKFVKILTIHMCANVIRAIDYHRIKYHVNWTNRIRPQKTVKMRCMEVPVWQIVQSKFECSDFLFKLKGVEAKREEF